GRSKLRIRVRSLRILARSRFHLLARQDARMGTVPPPPPFVVPAVAPPAWAERGSGAAPASGTRGEGRSGPPTPTPSPARSATAGSCPTRAAGRGIRRGGIRFPLA